MKAKGSLQEGDRRVRAVAEVMEQRMECSKEEPTSQGVQAASRNWKRQRHGFSPRASRKSQPCQHLYCSPVRPILDLGN